MMAKGTKKKRVVDPLKLEFGRRVRQVREERQMTQEELGDRLRHERTKGAVAHWEAGLTTPELPTIEDLARVLDVDLLWLAFGKDRKEAISITGEIELGGIVVEPLKVETVPLPPSPGARQIALRAYRVRRDSLPLIRQGDLLYAAEQPCEPQRAQGQDAIVELENGQTVLRTVELSDQLGCVTLVDQRGNTMRDVRPVSVRLVVSITRGFFAGG
jgi:transcriptional regulator with XRE-family HTH domain